MIQSGIKKTDRKLQIVYGEVYVPGIPDSHGDFMTEETVRKAAHGFLRDLNLHNIDQEHDNSETGSYVVESFIARKNDPDFVCGAWVVGVHIPDQSLWDQVEKGEINGFSLQAMAMKIPREVEMVVPEYVEGGTAEAAGHEHRFKVFFSEDGTLIGGQTDVVQGHSHEIKRGTATETADEHNHRFSFVELMGVV